MDAVEFQAALDAVDLTAVDAKAQISALNAGLMESNTTLLGESKANKLKAQESDQAAVLARQTAATAKEAELVAAGKTDELKKFYEDQLAEKTAELQLQSDAAVNALTERDKGAVINDILSSVDPRYKAFVETQLKSSVSISYNEEGQPVIVIQDGDAQYSSAKDFLGGVKESDLWKHVLTAKSLSGANTKQSTSTAPSSESKTAQEILYPTI